MLRIVVGLVSCHIVNLRSWHLRRDDLCLVRSLVLKEKHLLLLLLKLLLHHKHLYLLLLHHQLLIYLRFTRTSLSARQTFLRRRWHLLVNIAVQDFTVLMLPGVSPTLVRRLRVNVLLYVDGTTHVSGIPFLSLPWLIPTLITNIVLSMSTVYVTRLVLFMPLFLLNLVSLWITLILCLVLHYFPFIYIIRITSPF